MPTRSEQARAVEKRTVILNSAIELLLDEGLKGVTHRQVAAAAGVPVGSIGYYYSSREKLIATCFEHLTHARSQAFQRAIGGKTDLRDPVQFAEAVVTVIACGVPERSRDLMSAFVDAQREEGEVQKLVDATLAQLRDMVGEMLRCSGVEGITAARIVQIVVGTAVTEQHPTAPVAAVTDLLRLAGA